MEDELLNQSPRALQPLSPQEQQPQPRGVISERRGSIDRSPEAKEKEIEENMAHELTDLEGTSITSAFDDFSYWKPEVDHNIDELISEAKSKAN